MARSNQKSLGRRIQLHRLRRLKRSDRGGLSLKAHARRLADEPRHPLSSVASEWLRNKRGER